MIVSAEKAEQCIESLSNLCEAQTDDTVLQLPTQELSCLGKDDGSVLVSRCPLVVLFLSTSLSWGRKKITLWTINTKCCQTRPKMSLLVLDLCYVKSTLARCIECTHTLLVTHTDCLFMQEVKPFPLQRGVLSLYLLLNNCNEKAS